MGVWRRVRSFGLVAATLLTTLSGCYLPDKFMAEIRISRSGAYAINFRGDLVYGPLYADIAQGKVPPEDAAKKIAALERDLRRDSAFKKLESLGQGRFRVHYERQGVLERTGLVTFVRRNAAIMSIKATDNGTITVRTNKVSPPDAEWLMQNGLPLTGEFRVVTDATVLEHNATEIRQYQGWPVYVWRIENAMSPTPKMVMLSLAGQKPK